MNFHDANNFAFHMEMITGLVPTTKSTFLLVIELEVLVIK